MILERKRWLILVAGVLANICQGAAYASSIFAKPMLIHLGCLVPGPTGDPVPDMTKWVIAFSISMTCSPLGMLLGGRLTDRRKGRLVLTLGGILFGLGMLLSGYANTLASFYITFGIMMGLGSGSAYGAVVSTTVRWFPDRRGLASGLVVGAIAFGSFMIAPVAIWLMAIAPDQNQAVLYTFKVLGAAFLVIIAISSVIMTDPASDYAPKGYKPKPSTVKTARKEDVIWTRMIVRRRFWMLYVMYACGTFSGLMIISQASPIAQTMTSDIKALGDVRLITAAAGAVVALLGLANATGRVFWGFISDHIGRLQSLTLMFFITGIMMLLLPKLVVESESLKFAAILIGACFGGYIGTFPSLCADTFGSKNLAINYGLMFSAFSVAAVAGPYVGAAINKSSGSYNNAFLIAGVVSLVGLFLALATLVRDRKP